MANDQSETERQVAAKAGLGNRQEFGRRPALLIIDVVKFFTGSTPRETIEAVEEYRFSCGTSAWAARDSIQQPLDTARQSQVPVIYTKCDPMLEPACGDSVKGTPQEDIYHLYTTPIHPAIASREGEFVLQKTKASAFFATPLSTYLTRLGINCLVVAGTTTSGCVRASVVDGCSHGYRVFVVEQACFDRFETSHLVNLFDINAKYADVIQFEEAIAYLRGAGTRDSTADQPATVLS